MYLEDNTNNKATLEYGKDCPYIEILWEDERIFVSNAVLRLIGNPMFIRFRWNAVKRLLIIEPTDSSDPNGLSVTDWQNEQDGSLVLCSDIFVFEIWSENWGEQPSFRIVAKYNEPSNIAIFDLKSAVPSEVVKGVLC